MFARGGWEGCDARGWKLLANPVAEAKEATTRFERYVSGNIIILPEGDFGEKNAIHKCHVRMRKPHQFSLNEALP